MWKKEPTQEEIQKRIEYLQSRIEWALDKNLPELRKELAELTSEIINLYKEVSEVPSNETINNRELEILLEPIEQHPEHSIWMYLLLFELARIGYLKRDALLVIGLYKLMIDHAIQLESRFDTFFTWTIRNIYADDPFGLRVPLTGERIDNIISYRIKNTHYSTRIWNNTRVLNEKLYNVLQLGLHTDLPVEQMANIISQHTGASYSASVRLVKTELNAVYNNTLLAYYKDAGFTKVQQISTLDMRTSDLCRHRHLAIIDISNAKIGEDIPPLHPYCRSIIVPIITEPTGVKR